MSKGTIATAREIAGTPGFKRRLAVVTGCMIGALIGSDAYRGGATAWYCAFMGIISVATFTPLVICSLALGDVVAERPADTRPRRSPEEVKTFLRRLQVASVAMGLTAMSISMASVYLSLR